MSGVIGVAGLTADYPAAPLGVSFAPSLHRTLAPEQDLEPAITRPSANGCKFT